MKIKDLIQSISKQVLNVNFIFSHVFIPLGVLSVYCVSLMYYLPEGVNKVFVVRSAKLFLPLTAAIAVLFIIYFLIIGLKKAIPQFFSSPKEEFHLSDLLLPLLPLTPVVQYLINNSEILTWFDGIVIFCAFLFLVSILIFIVPRLFVLTGSTRPLMFLGMAFAFILINMASMTGHYKWYEEGSLKIQLLLFGSICLISWILYTLKLRNLLYLFILLNFVSNTIIQFVNLDVTEFASDTDTSDNLLIQMVGVREPVKTPGIYLLIYDAYVENETMLGHGIDNLDQQQYLEDQGFKIYPDTYSIMPSTVHSMSRVLNVSTNYYGDKRKAISGDGVVQNLLQKYGYKTYGVFNSYYHIRGIIPTYDYSYPESSSQIGLIIKGVFMGELRADLDVKYISQEEYIHEKEIVLSEIPEEPRFVYMHTLLPSHSQNSGVCRPNEIELYSERLDRANVEMRQDLALVMENDPGAIVIVAGDHGPHLTKSCTSDLGGLYDISEITRFDIQDRFGTFLAIKWPSSDFDEYDDITILQDLFPAIFSYIFEDQSLLESKIEPIMDNKDFLSGVQISDGIIIGGPDDGEPLFP